MQTTASFFAVFTVNSPTRQDKKSKYDNDMVRKKALLMILDGWGIGNKGKGDVIYNTPTPFLDKLNAEYPHSKLLASGENVGLPDGQMGNSEVGHLNIGAGRIVFQDLVKINRAIADGSILENKEIVSAYQYAKEKGCGLHIMGLVSNGGVHSELSHLFKLIDIAGTYGVGDKTYVHCFMDGRDTDPRSGKGFIEKLEKECDKQGAHVATIIGRFYAMDRDKRWNRLKIAYDNLVNGEGRRETDMVAAVQGCYDRSTEENKDTDEFMEPLVNAKVDGRIKPNDVVIFFNYRNDRAKELTTVLTQQEGLKQLHTAETEKYAHVTFFFNGGRETPYEGEDRILVASPKVATYDLKPEMSAFEVKDKLVEAIRADKYDFIVVNFANGDMVGHTGVYEAIEKAVIAIDQCVKEVVTAANETDYETIIIADHGNADNAINADGSPNTAHSLNPVPFIYVTANKGAKVKDGVLADVAPSILHILGLPQPKEMTGHDLIED